MKASKSPLFALALPALVLLSACASSYDAYPCGKVPYCYCSPRPLPHSDCNACPTCVTSKYLAQPQDEPSSSEDPGYPSQ